MGKVLRQFVERHHGGCKMTQINPKSKKDEDGIEDGRYVRVYVDECEQ